MTSGRTLLAGMGLAGMGVMAWLMTKQSERDSARTREMASAVMTTTGEMATTWARLTEILVLGREQPESTQPNSPSSMNSSTIETLPEGDLTLDDLEKISPSMASALRREQTEDRSMLLEPSSTLPSDWGEMP